MPSILDSFSNLLTTTGAVARTTVAGSIAGAATDIKLFVNPHLSPPASSLVVNQWDRPKTSYRELL